MKTMESRRNFLKTTAALALALPLANLPNLALAATSSGSISMKEAVKGRRRPRFLSDFIIKWINRRIKGTRNKEDAEQILAYIEKNPSAMRKEVDRVVKQLTSGKYEELPDEKFASIRIKFRIKFKPPSSFEASLEISF